MPQTTYHNAFCARCQKKGGPQNATTLSGAIKKTTLECSGIIQTQGGPKLTRCATSFDMGSDD